jgi:hypothetical protein
MHGAHAHITDQQEVQAIQAAKFAIDRIQVSQYLGRMFSPSITGIDDRNTGPASCLMRRALLEVAHDDSITVKLQHSNRIFDRFLIKVARAGHFCVREAEHVPTQTVHGGLVGQPGAGAGLVEGCHQALST